ncbi:hypothetical protein MCEMRE249_00042 [Candidatus Nanopelagicaceae bacterium]
MLIECLGAARESGADYVLLVTTKKLSAEITNLANEVIPDPGCGLAEAINCGMNNLPPEISFATWIGDDDLYEKNGLKVLAKKLETQQGFSLVYGKCVYINSKGDYLGVNQIGQFAGKILKYGPDLIPQPSSLFRLQDFFKVGGLNPKYKNAFDFDLFLKLKKLGKLGYIPEEISFFRWHEESLSVDQRWRGVTEASSVRKSHLNRWVSPISFIWEYPVILLTFLAGKIVSLRSGARKPIP